MIPTLTGLRGFALLLVVLAELAAANLLAGEFGFGLDQVGLMIFVTVSGFLLALRHGQEPWNRFAVADFLAARARRLLPWYAVVLLVAIVIQRWWLEWPYRIESVGDGLRAVFLLDAPGPLWIVPVIAQCWVLFVVVWWVWSRGQGVLALPLATLVVLALLAALPAALGWGPGAGHSLSVAAPYFLVGVGLGLVWSSRVEPVLHQRSIWVSIGGGLAFVLACMNLPAVREAHGWNLSSTVVGSTWFEPLTALIVVALVVASAAGPLSLAVLSTAPLRFLGRHAYLLYLIAPVVIAAIPG